MPYYRVSTEKQGATGLGIDGQKAAVLTYVKGAGCDVDGGIGRGGAS